MPTSISDDALEEFFLANVSGLKAENGLLVNTDVPNGNIFIDAGNNGLWRALRRNINAPFTGVVDELSQFNYGTTFSTPILVDGGETIDLLEAAHALNPAWQRQCFVDCPTLPAGGVVKVSGGFRPTMRGPTAAENGGASTTGDGVSARIGISFDNTDSPTIYEVGGYTLLGSLVNVSRMIHFEVSLDPSIVVGNRIRLHVLADGASVSDAMRVTALSNVWIQVEW